MSKCNNGDVPMTEPEGGPSAYKVGDYVIIDKVYEPDECKSMFSKNKWKILNKTWDGCIDYTVRNSEGGMNSYMGDYKCTISNQNGCTKEIYQHKFEGKVNSGGKKRRSRKSKKIKSKKIKRSKKSLSKSKKKKGKK